MAAQREWFEKDYYKVLGVDKSVSDKELTRAYRKLAKAYHPDSHPGSEEKFKEIATAYQVLGDPAKRKEYDEARQMGGMFNGAANPGTGPGGVHFDVGDFTDLLGGLFNRGRPRGPSGGPQRGGDVEAELHLSFDDAVTGVTTSVMVSSDGVCTTCGGTGSAPGSSPETCSRCGGRGSLADNQGLFSFSRPCPECGGRGVKILNPCPDCHGLGRRRQERRVRVRIPAGVEDGSRLRIRERGGLGRNGGPNGDLWVTVRVAPHKLFGRRGLDLLLTVPVTFPEAALGASISVPTLTRPVTLKIPPGTRSGQTFRVAGKGIAQGSLKGDLLVTVEVVVPKDLSESARKAVEALAAADSTPVRAHLGV